MSDQQKIINVNSIFRYDYLDSKIFYMYIYQQPPCITWISQVNAEKVFEYIKTEYAETITGIYQNSFYERKSKKVEFDKTVILMRHNCLVELCGSYCEIFHTHQDYEMANALIKEISRFKRREKRKDFEINLVMVSEDSLYLKPMEIKKTNLRMDLFYEDNFLPVHKTIIERLNKKDDKGVVLLHGLPGTGKTTYIRHLVGKLKKKVLLISPAVAKSIMSPDFMDLLIDNPNCILVIEDAENIITDRRFSNNSSVSNLLNVSDGLLSDFLNVQIICTFNHPLSLVDAALMRQGRLIAKYEFGKLSTGKAQTLSNHLGFDTAIREPMTIAEIANQHEKKYTPDRVEVIGFRRALLEN
jgi:hypothetical protein